MHKNTVILFRKKDKAIDPLTEFLRYEVRDRSGEALRFRSSLMPFYVRRSRSLDAVLLRLCL